LQTNTCSFLEKRAVKNSSHNRPNIIQQFEREADPKKCKMWIFTENRAAKISLQDRPNICQCVDRGLDFKDVICEASLKNRESGKDLNRKNNLG